MSGGHPTDGLAVELTRRWTRAYTRWLPPESGQARRDEIEADLHDHVVAARAGGGSSGSLSRAIALRMLLGVPADLSWRHHHLRARRRAGRKENAMAAYRTGTARTLVIAGGLLILGWTLFVVTKGVLQSREDGWSGFWWNAPILLATALATVVGLTLVARGTPAGGYWLAAAAISSTVWLVWLSPVPVAGVLIAIGFATYAYRGRRRVSPPAGEPVPS